MDLVVIDGPNLFNTVASQIETEEGLLKLYLEECFDIDQLALASLRAAFGPVAGITRMGIVIFHSRKPLGRKPYYLSAEKTDSFWARQGSNPNTSTVTVDIPGDQQDTFTFECKECGHKNEVVTRGEKGIDTSITTYLMETLESWTSMCLFSRDVDYAPLVAALRRKGKQVYVAVPPDEKASALVRIAQSTVPLDLEFVRSDLAATQYVMPGGILDELVGVLQGHDDIPFAVDARAEDSLSLGITHPQGAESRLRQLIDPPLDRLGAMKRIIKVEQRNGRFLILKLRRDESVRRRLDRFSPLAKWGQHAGDIFALHREVVRVR